MNSSIRRSSIGKRRRSSSGRRSSRNVRRRIPFEPELVAEHLRDEYSLYHMLIDNELFGTEMERKQAMELLRDYVRTQCRDNNVRDVDCDNIILEKLRPSASRSLHLEGGVLGKASRFIGEKLSAVKSSFITYLKESKESFASNVLHNIIRMGAHLLVILAILTVGMGIVGFYNYTWLPNLVSSVVSFMMSASPIFASLWKFALSTVMSILPTQLIYDSVKTRVFMVLIQTVCLSLASTWTTSSHNVGIRKQQKRVQQTGRVLSPEMIAPSRKYFTELKKDLKTGMYESKPSYDIRFVIGVMLAVAKGFKTGVTKMKTVGDVSADVGKKAYGIYIVCVDRVTNLSVQLAKMVKMEADVQVYGYTGRDLSEWYEISKNALTRIRTAIRTAQPLLYEELENAVNVIHEEFELVSSRSPRTSRSPRGSRSPRKSSSGSKSTRKSNSGSKSPVKSASKSPRNSKSPKKSDNAEADSEAILIS